jgi:hypothetical protein
MLADAPSFSAIQSGSGVSLNFSDLGGLITNVVPFIFGLVGLLLLIYLILGGLQLMTSRGEPKAVAGAQAKITNALIGFVIVLISAGLVVLLGRILGVGVFSQLF